MLINPCSEIGSEVAVDLDAGQRAYPTRLVEQLCAAVRSVLQVEPRC